MMLWTLCLLAGFAGATCTPGPPCVQVPDAVASATGTIATDGLYEIDGTGVNVPLHAHRKCGKATTFAFDAPGGGSGVLISTSLACSECNCSQDVFYFPRTSPLFVGVDTFTFTASSSDGTSSSGTATVAVDYADKTIGTSGSTINSYRGNAAIQVLANTVADGTTFTMTYRDLDSNFRVVLGQLPNSLMIMDYLLTPAPTTFAKNVKLWFSYGTVSPVISPAQALTLNIFGLNATGGWGMCTTARVVDTVGKKISCQTTTFH